MKKWKWLTLCLILLLTVGCGKKSQPQQTTQPTAASTRPTEAPTETTLPEYPPSHYINNVYSRQLRRYYTALLEQWPQELYSEEERSPMGAQYSQGDPLENVGFALEDLDGDGLMELIIGAIREAETEPLIFEIWTASAPEPQRLACSQPGDLYYLEKNEDSWLLQRRSGTGEEPDGLFCYSLGEGELVLEWGLRRKENEGEVSWQVIASREETQEQTVSGEEAGEKILQLSQQRYVPRYYPFYLYTP